MDQREFGSTINKLSVSSRDTDNNFPLCNESQLWGGTKILESLLTLTTFLTIILNRRHKESNASMTKAFFNMSAL